MFWRQFSSSTPIHEISEQKPSSDGDIDNASEALEILRDEVAKVIRSNEEIQIVRRQKESADAQISIYRNGYNASQAFLELT